MNKTEFLEAVNKSQHCQRNWDLSKEVDIGIVEWLMEVGYATPTKQNLDTFEVVCIKDRSIIQQFSKAATNSEYNYYLLSNTLKEELQRGRNQNPQTDANLLFLFFHKPEERTSNVREEREGGAPEDKNKYLRNTGVEIGLSASAIAIAANSIGLRSGFCRCVYHDILPQDILSQYNLDKFNLEIMLGIGYPLFKEHTTHTDNVYSSPTFSKYTPRKLIIDK